MSPSFGVNALAGSVLGNAVGQQMQMNQVDNQFHNQMIMGRNSINITNQNAGVQQQSHTK